MLDCRRTAAIQHRLTAVLWSIPKRPLLTVSRSFMNVANRVLWRMAIILKANKVNLFVYSVLFVFCYHPPNVLDTLHICNISWLRVKWFVKITFQCTQHFVREYNENFLLVGVLKSAWIHICGAQEIIYVYLFSYLYIYIYTHIWTDVIWCGTSQFVEWLQCKCPNVEVRFPKGLWNLYEFVRLQKCGEWHWVPPRFLLSGVPGNSSDPPRHGEYRTG
jgi:hypothetical protein